MSFSSSALFASVKKLYNVKFKVAKVVVGSSGRALGSQSEGCGFDPLPMLEGGGVKAMPESIPAPKSGSLYQENTGSQMGHTKKMCNFRYLKILLIE